MKPIVVIIILLAPVWLMLNAVSYSANFSWDAI